ncbi:1,6-anhydro-N-acetylmuramyl-L-alanine amidase AmpD [Sinimarinibacterium flocculans]|uniref:1,6-anhydro-N-acetylmuramyl-L-alanine amidase AmpD n=1 Tax=Sinimarinibacterium flocculans TaxID=985250 RepID=UPI00351730F2
MSAQTRAAGKGSPRVSADGWLAGARRLPSPNCDDRPPGESVSLLVIHGISMPPGTFGGPGIDALFCNTLDPGEHPAFAEVAALRVSAHLLIRRDGRVTQYVPFERRAWHAGVSRFDGRERCNDFSIGIELEGTDTRAYTQRQYRRLARVIAAIRQRYPAIVPQRIVGHSDIAPGRKTDPGPSFDWQRLRALIA